MKWVQVASVRHRKRNSKAQNKEQQLKNKIGHDKKQTRGHEEDALREEPNQSTTNSQYD